MKTYVLVFLLLSFFSGFSQKKTPKLAVQVDSILQTKPTTYKAINYYLRPFRRDTTKLKELIAIFKKVNYLDGKTYCENLLGIQFRNYSLFDKAIAIHKQALQTAEQAGSIEFRVFSLNMLGVDYRKIDANRTALDYNHEALSLADKVVNPGLGLKRSTAVSLNSMGNIYLLLKQYDLAIERFKSSMKIEAEIGNELGLAINNHNIGYAREAQGNIAEALKYYKKSTDINVKINNTYGLIICKSSLATIYIKQNKPKEAIRLINENFEDVKNLGNKEFLAYHFINLGWAQSKLNQFVKAEKNLEKGLEISKEYNFATSISDAYNNLAELNEKKRNFEKALEYYKLSEEFDEKITNERNIQYVNDLIIKYDRERQNNQIKNLAKQNEIARLQLSRNRTIWIVVSLIILSFFIIAYFLYRQRLLTKEKRIVTLEQDMLRAQMNPHFIFNALNSIKHYIINNEQKNAVHYLNKFSKLVRKILESSQVKEITLAEELATMDLYLNIENIRFSNEIHYEFKVDDTLNLSNIKVPPLILQPFLENALWHGLSSKKGEKRVAISVFKHSKDFIQIDIEDNGIGRNASAKIKSAKTIHKKSIGIELTKERLQNFIKDFKNPFSLQFNDLFDENENALGTKVGLKIPVL